MIEGQCNDCGNTWSTRKHPEDMADPKCPECNSRSPDFNFDSPGFDPDRAVGAEEGDTRVEELEEALRATPGVGEAGVSYASYWFSNGGADDPEALHDCLLELDGVGTSAARRIVESVFGEEKADDGTPPFSFGDGGGEPSFIDQLVKARRAGLVGGSESGATDAEAVAQAVSEAMRPALQQMSQTQQMLAESRQDENSELDDLREDLQELREEREKEELAALEEKIERMAGDGGPDEELAKLRETREMVENAPQISAKAAKDWESVAHSLLDRLTSLERQRAMLGEPGADARQPAYTPPHRQEGRPQQRPAETQRAGQQPARERPEGSPPSGSAGHQQPASHPDATTDGGRGDDREVEPGESADDPDADADGAAEEKGREVREKLGLDSDDDGDSGSNGADDE